MSLKAFRRLLIGLCTATFCAGAPSPARAGCLELDLAIHVTNQPDQYLIGPDHCVTDTPWNQVESVYYDESTTGLPPGTPSGVYFEVWFPSP